MLEAVGDLFYQNCDAICITTNTFVKKDGCSVMGRGTAAQAVKRWPILPRLYGQRLVKQEYGAICLTNPSRILSCEGTNLELPYHLIAFPVKPKTDVCGKVKENVVSHMVGKYYPGDIIPGWACTAKLSIILASCADIVRLATNNKWIKVCLPRPGCGAGELAWDIVKKYIAKELDDRFVIVMNER